MHNLTHSQHEAIYNHERNLIVVAGAGSGKTFVLVERYLAVLDAHRDWPLNAVAAITFTKKAAQEMRHRVRQALESRYENASDETEQSIWATRLGGMESARIDTIHGLCASLLRGNAAEIGVDPDFRVLDEVQAQIILDETIGSVFNQVTREANPLSKLFTEYDLFTIRNAVGQHISNLDLEVVDENELLRIWGQAWAEHAHEQLQGLSENPHWEICTNWIPEGGWPENSDDKILAIWQTCWEALSRMQNAGNTSAQIEALHALATSIKLVGGRNAVWGGKEGLDEAKEVLRSIREISKSTLELIGEQPGEVDRKAAGLLPLWVGLIKTIQAEYWRVKHENNQLDFNDLERLTRQLLSRSGAAQQRYQGEEIKHLLIDEFQDTNPSQWEIAQGLANINEAGRLFVVGDPKQSIYMFRGADVSVFDAVKQEIQATGGQEIALARSFRTHQKLIDGFNSCFSHILQKTPGSAVSAYEVELDTLMEAERETAPSEIPAVDLLLVDRKLMGDDNNADTRRVWEAGVVAERLREIVEVEQRPVYDRQNNVVRPITYGDIVILFQSMRAVTTYEDALKDAEIPFVTIAGQGYYNRQEVWDVINALKAIHNPADDLALATALRSPLFGLSDEALLALRLQRDGFQQRLPLWEALEIGGDVPQVDVERVRFAYSCLHEIREIAGRVTVAELMRQLFNKTGYLAVLTGLPDGDRRRGNVEKLIDKAEVSGQITIGSFSAYLDDLSTREIREGEATLDTAHAITLMTVHASKGLEFPLVVLVDSNWTLQSNYTSALVYDHRYGLACKVYDEENDQFVPTFAYDRATRLQEMREIAERKRLLYVAMTRAQDYLLISGEKPSDTTSKNPSWMRWLLEAIGCAPQMFDVGEHVVEHPAFGTIRIQVPAFEEGQHTYPTTQAVLKMGWDDETIQKGEFFPLAVEMPPLLGNIIIEPSLAARHITATQIADLGSAQYELAYRQRFRHSMLHDAPGTIETISQQQNETVSQRMIGEIVHKALGWWQLPDRTPNFDAVIRHYAWELGIMNEKQHRYATDEARKLLQRITQSEVYHWLEGAKQIFREIPFIFRTDKRFIHGIIDVLFQRDDGKWGVLDYKTSYVKEYQGHKTRNLVIEHARRYHLQIGVYAAAIQEQVGVIPEAHIYYIRYGETVNVKADEWQSALHNLEHLIGELLEDQAE